MRKIRRLVSSVLLTLLFGAGAGYSQGVIDRQHMPSDERVDPFERRADVIDGNNVRASITNWGQTANNGQAIQYFYEWPKNTNRQYVALTQLWVGAEVVDNTGQTTWIVEVADFRQNPIDENQSWTFEPIAGYVNPAGSEFGIAQSDEPESFPPFWPDKVEDDDDPGWPGSWNGFFGKDILNADQEFFYKIGDDRYDRYVNYFPDSTDLSRKGLGLITEVRIMSWSQILIDKAIFLIHAIKNDGTRNLPRVGFTIWLADLVGGDATDDIPFFDVIEDVAFMTDADGIGNDAFGADPVGVAAIAFLETPGNAEDRIDNDADGSTAPECVPEVGECNSPVVPPDFLEGEEPANGIDDNGNGLIDESEVHIPFEGEQASSPGVGYADHIDNDNDGESEGPVVTQEMIAVAETDRWNRWPPNIDDDPIHRARDGSLIVNLLGVDQSDLDAGFKDNIDNDDSHVTPTPEYPYLSEPGSPTITQEIVDAAAADPYGRYRVPNTDVILLAVGPEDLGKAYADGRDNDGDGAVDEGIDEGIDEMIDESRADGIDNDGDWNILQDDTGLDGIAQNGDPGDSDGIPTSGAGTPFPGEKNIDITDVAESDQIGLTNVQIIPAFSLNFNSQSDRFLYFSFMIPGDLDINIPEPGENDLVITSSLFPLAAGQTERMSLSVQLGQDIPQALNTRDNALNAYLEDYQFAQAPITPDVTAVPGDGRVTLYWDTDAEDSFDNFLEGIGRDPFDFEGYRIYRATDPAFIDSRTITDGFGNTLFRRPVAQFDLINGNEGFHPTDINGTKFFLGTNRQDDGEDENGLTHVWIDEDVTNGVTYFYAVVSYDYGSAIDNIPPTESTTRIRRLPDGTIETGRNVVEVRPAAAPVGYVDADVVDLRRTAGFTSSVIGYRIIDPRVIADGDQYRITFADTVREGDRNTPDTVTTLNFSLDNLTTGETLLDSSQAIGPDDEFPILDDFGRPLGFELIFMNATLVELNRQATSWNDDDIYPISLRPYLAAGFLKGFRNPADYRVEVVSPGQGQSDELQVRRTVTLPSRPTNVRVFNTSTGREVKYAFWDLTGDDFTGAESTEPATLSADPSIAESDRIIIIEPQVGGDPNEEIVTWDLTGDDFTGAESTEPATFSADPSIAESDRIVVIEPQVGGDPNEEIVTWEISLNFVFSENRDPTQGDEAEILTRKPFLSTDVFEFSTSVPAIDTDSAASILDDIHVVPNPYIATNTFEALNPFNSGRGPRRIQFVNVPPQCTIRIYSVAGRLVRRLDRNMGSNDVVGPDDVMDGIVEWNLQSEDNLTVSYGVYLYHVEAPGIGETEGTFAIIK